MTRLFTRALGLGLVVGVCAALVAVWEAGWHNVTNPPRSLAEVDLAMAGIVALLPFVGGWLLGTIVAFVILRQRRVRRGESPP